MWSINTISSDSASGILINASGNIQSYNTDHGFEIKPVLYLKSSIFVIDGNGSEKDPYIIAV